MELEVHVEVAAEPPPVPPDSPEDAFLHELSYLSDAALLRATVESLHTGRLTPLIKEELRCRIQSRRLSEGKDELTVHFESPTISEVSAPLPPLLTPVLLSKLSSSSSASCSSHPLPRSPPRPHPTLTHRVPKLLTAISCFHTRVGRGRSCSWSCTWSCLRSVTFTDMFTFLVTCTCARKRSFKLKRSCVGLSVVCR
ncbi:hypothetical protein C0Q70_14138 [Pomacea canaliculata]|uniref:Uncharacterized protein n=1 Tax=Pomacea canaliculata TaxID=400727 RepID=A0A2T7NZ64_POMCA|nr:hypothetical protein C0Q70_14138 [Pomacea canaliculata]